MSGEILKKIMYEKYRAECLLEAQMAVANVLLPNRDAIEEYFCDDSDGYQDFINLLTDTNNVIERLLEIMRFGRSCTYKELRTLNDNFYHNLEEVQKISMKIKHNIDLDAGDTVVGNL